MDTLNKELTLEALQCKAAIKTVILLYVSQ